MTNPQGILIREHNPNNAMYHGDRLRAAAYMLKVPYTGHRRMGCGEVTPEYVKFRAYDGDRQVTITVPNDGNIDYHTVLLQLIVQI